MLKNTITLKNQNRESNIMKKIDYTGSLADYKKSVSADNGDTAEGRRQKNMVMEADLNDQSKGAADYIANKYGASGKIFDAKDFNNYKEFENSVLDVMSEGEVSSKYPTDVWERAAKRYTKEVFKKSKSNKK